ncbi:MAG TPA: aminoglycoside phosphotransferase family protein [Longimicrobium sp.]|nr:aminoglycoside phosphotransferase family protein [Longimicrobium sp.]
MVSPLDAPPAADPRCHPLVELDRGQVQAMLRPLLGGSRLRAVSRVEGGLVNTTYRVTAGAEDTAYAVRVYAAGPAAFEAEGRRLSALAGRLSVPQVLLADPGGRRCPHPFVVYRWIEGITLNGFRRQASAGELLALAEPLGRLAARVAGTRLEDADLAGGMGGLPAVRIAAELEHAENRLRTGPARERLGGTLADGLRECLAAEGPRLHALERTCGLLHGDFGGRNILVNAGKTGRWEISGLLDWESAARGAVLWDVGSFFRYSRRYSPGFRDRFAGGYRAEGGELGRGWWRAARLLDATRLVRILGEERELPNVFAECRDLVGSLLEDSA